MHALALIIQPASKEKIEEILQKHLLDKGELEFYFCIGLHQAWRQRQEIGKLPFKAIYIATPLITNGGRTSAARVLGVLCKPFRSTAYLVDETGQIQRCSWGRVLFYDIPNLALGAFIGLLTLFISLILVWAFRQYLRWSN